MGVNVGWKVGVDFYMGASYALKNTVILQRLGLLVHTFVSSCKEKNLNCVSHCSNCNLMILFMTAQRPHPFLFKVCLYSFGGSFKE